LWFKGLVEKHGIDLNGLSLLKVNKSNGKEVHAVVAQGYKLEQALGGREALVNFLIKTIGRMVSEEEKAEVEPYVRGYFEDRDYDKQKLVRYDLNSEELLDTRIVAVVSATLRLLKILSAENETKAKEWQANGNADKFLRQRVLKGAGMDVTDKTTRSLPVGGIAVILDELTNL
jgi:hypothetical protein